MGAVSPTPAPLAPGMVGYWPLHGDASNSVAGGTNGTLAGGAVFVTNGFPYAYSLMLPSSNSLVDIRPSTNLNIFGHQKLSVAFWANYTNTVAPVYRQYAGAVQTAGYGGNSFIVRFPSGSPKLYVDNKCGDDGPTWQVPTNEWIHYVCTYDSTNKVWYSNGVNVATIACGGADAVRGATNVPTWIGNNYESTTTTNRNFPGFIQEVMIATNAWNPADVVKLYHEYYGQPFPP